MSDALSNEIIYGWYRNDDLEAAYAGGKASMTEIGVPEYLQRGIARWVLYGELPGDFLVSVICHDLFDAVAYADETSLAALRQITQFFYNRCPRQCHDGDAQTNWPGMKALRETAA